MSTPFAPPEQPWRRVSVRLRHLRRLLIASCVVAAALVASVVLRLVLAHWWPVAAVAALAAATIAWGWWWAARNQAAWGYAEDAEELYVTRGVMWRRLVVIPYGRMQFVDVTAGPLQRRFALATVTLHTASTHTAADIPGLEEKEAVRLRNRLTELGESRAAGL